MQGRTIYRATEHQLTDKPIPIDSIIVHGMLDIYEDVLGRNYFSYSLRRGALQITAGNYIGLIPLNDRVALLVEPKVSRNNWLYIVGRAEGHLDELAYLRNYELLGVTSSSLLEFLSRVFVRQLEAVEERGLYMQYQHHVEVTSFPRGKVLFGDSIRSAWSRGRSYSVAVQYYILSRDIPHNRLLKFALYLATSYLDYAFRRDSTSSKGFNNTVRALENLLQYVPLDMSLRYLPEVRASLDRASLPESRAYYVDILRTAILLVEQLGLLPTLAALETNLSFVVNMEVIFEEYCFKVLRSNSSMIGNSITVNKEPDGAIKLFSEGRDDRMAQPDIVIADPSGPRLVLEVKYKADPSRDDINQVIAYATAYKLSRVVLICFTDDGKLKGWEHKGQVGGQIDVSVYRLNLDAVDMQAEERDFTIAIREAIPSKVKHLT